LNTPSWKVLDKVFGGAGGLSDRAKSTIFDFGFNIRGSVPKPELALPLVSNSSDFETEVPIAWNDLEGLGWMAGGAVTLALIAAGSATPSWVGFVWVHPKPVWVGSYNFGTGLLPSASVSATAGYWRMGNSL